MNKIELSLKFKSVFETAIDGIILISSRGVIEEINAAVTKLFGYTKEDLLGKNINVLMPEPHHSGHDGYIQNYLKTRKANIIGIGREVEGLRKDGSVFPFRLAVSEIKLENETMFTGFIHDLTEERKAQANLKEYVDNLELIVQDRTNLLEDSNKKLALEIEEKNKTEDALIESQKLYETIAQNFPNGTISVLDRDLNFLFIEGQGLRDFGFGTKELIGKNYLDVIQVKLRDLVNQKLQVVFDDIPSTFELEHNKNTFRVRAVPLVNNAHMEDRILLVESNITQQKNAEKEIYNSLQKEKELNEMKSKFVSMASHEFRTPLSTILSSAGLINKYIDVNQTAKITRHTERIQNNVRNLTMILNDFLSLEKLENNNLTSVVKAFDIIECASEVKEDMQMLKKSGQNITLQHNLKDTDIHTDRFVIQNILTNLLSNAIKYSKEDSDICIDIEKEANDLSIKVTDNGIGISQEDQKQLFQRFFRASNSGNVQGTGLGLHIIKRYVDLLGGEIFFESELDKGSTFGFVLRNLPG
ncbi:MAG: PAS domain S-box protein [Bacteroidetes bacterium]|jgi:PAS domain S-box-containing protein|nr:PAS domain S-box protein [Bacteroidota bacterium]